MSTTLGLVHLVLHVPQATSLKDKRRSVKGFKDRVASRFNVSIAEVDSLDNRRRAVLAVAMVGNDKRYIEAALQQIINAASRHRDMILAESQTEWL
ncbi:MAG TPA: DUF503 domain-containing protein [Phycisphaerae bacterium]|nr:DUF503 domain-containing protein [Phycisphaerae bacterium]